MPTPRTATRIRNGFAPGPGGMRRCLRCGKSRIVDDARRCYQCFLAEKKEEAPADD